MQCNLFKIKIKRCAFVFSVFKLNSYLCFSPNLLLFFKIFYFHDRHDSITSHLLGSSPDRGFFFFFLDPVLCCLLQYQHVKYLRLVVVGLLLFLRFNFFLAFYNLRKRVFNTNSFVFTPTHKKKKKKKQIKRRNNLILTSIPFFLNY